MIAVIQSRQYIFYPVIFLALFLFGNITVFAVEEAFSLKVLRCDVEREIELDFSFNSREIQPLETEISRLIHISRNQNPRVSIEILSSSEFPVSNAKAEIRESGGSMAPILGEDGGLRENITVQMGKPAIMRSLRVAPLIIRPVSYDSASRTLRVIDHAVIRIEMDGSLGENVLHNSPRIGPSWNDYFKATVLNYDSTLADRSGEPENYLIFTRDEFEPRLQGFIAWKELEGFHVDVLRRSELPPWPSPAQLKNAIQQFYDGPNTPAYVLFCGDESATPIFYTYDPTHPGDYADDHYYAMLAGDDLLPDVFLGRLPAEDASELSTMLAKIMKYEQRADEIPLSFFQSAMMVASNLEESQVTTKEQTRERLETYCGYTNTSTFYEWDDNTAAAVIEGINAGVSIINYRGEGWRTGWNPLHIYWFDFDQVYQLNNTNQTPFVTSIGCGVSLFNESGDCWSHALMAHGSATEYKGAVGVIGPTWNTHTTYNNWLDRGIFRGYVFDHICRAGPMMNFGKQYMYDHFPEPEHFEYIDVQYRSYLLFGTPDMWVRLGVPSQAYTGVTYSNSSSERYLAVHDANGNVPAAALVSWSTQQERHVFATDEFGGVLLEPYLADVNTIDLVVTGKNLVPLQTTLPITLGTGSGELLITEIKPDIPCDGTRGDMVEIYNSGSTDVDLKGWMLTDLDVYDLAIVSESAILHPNQIAVIEFAGTLADEQITETDYGLFIISRENPDFSSLEDLAAIRNPMGQVVDCVAWHDASGTGSTNVAGDLSRLTPTTSPLDVLPGGWWDGPDEISQENYEANTVDWSAFAGNEGEGSIQRIMVTSPDSAACFTVQETTDFGHYQPAAFRMASRK